MKNKLLVSLRIAAIVLIGGQLFLFQHLYAKDDTLPAKGGIVLSFSDADSVKQVKATVTKVDAEGKLIPAPEVEMNIYAKKSYGLLPIGDAQTTDESGEISVEFPKNLPGDSLGNVTVVAKIDDNEELGSMEVSQAIKWGLPVKLEQDFNKRALWASGGNAPLPLVFTVTTMVFGVWAVIFYILVLLIKIKKSAGYEIENQH